MNDGVVRGDDGEEGAETRRQVLRDAYTPPQKTYIHTLHYIQIQIQIQLCVVLCVVCCVCACCLLCVVCCVVLCCVVCGNHIQIINT